MRTPTFTKVLRRIERLLAGGLNYVVTLDVKVLEPSGEELSWPEVVRRCYPESEPHTAKVRQVPLEEMKAEIDSSLGYEGDEGAGPRLTAAKRKQLGEELLPAFWSELEALLSLRDTDIYEYPSDKGLPGYTVFWFYAYVLHDRKQGRWIVLMGSSSD
ncbi:hypothetical protein [Hyalangium rubrum]|uniref:Uncharacterized protein n=1 Tax=Hyalangium rubrum TaxID=3103134 RepID=A0ABU5H489_9BACT|nr:hypothetical protein [Hyalangium sp. s54d21]MDY7227623.1 hypothetical protein [Hyalangium sp. s54d21]